MWIWWTVWNEEIQKRNSWKPISSLSIAFFSAISTRNAIFFLHYSVLYCRICSLGKAIALKSSSSVVKGYTEIYWAKVQPQKTWTEPIRTGCTRRTWAKPMLVWPCEERSATSLVWWNTRSPILEANQLNRAVACSRVPLWAHFHTFRV